jgi:hypothetical protein
MRIDITPKQKCNLDFDHVDSLDEISGDEQLALVWCRTHKKYEWKWCDREVIGCRRTRLVLH